MSQNVEIVSNIERKKFALNVRRDGYQPSIFVRTFRSFTIDAIFQLVNGVKGELVTRES
jgi:hypothetical protein